jgi:hypothetical protein
MLHGHPHDNWLFQICDFLVPDIADFVGAEGLGGRSYGNFDYARDELQLDFVL